MVSFQTSRQKFVLKKSEKSSNINLNSKVSLNETNVKTVLKAPLKAGLTEQVHSILKLPSPSKQKVFCHVCP